MTPSGRSRLSSLDALRGLIMAVMAIDHASVFVAHRHSSEFWAGEVTRYDSALPFLTRFVTHFCAPGFFFLMGCGMQLFATRREAAGWSAWRIARHLALRGVLLLVINQFVENPAWLIGTVFQESSALMMTLPGGGGQPMLVMGVLTGLGLNLIAGGLLIRLGSLVWVAAMLGALWVTNALVPGPGQMTVVYPPLIRLLLVPGHTGPLIVTYPLVPWLACTAAGVLFARLLERDPERVRSRAIWAGLAMIAAACALRAAGGFGNLRLPRDGSWIEFLNVIKYPPAMVFVLFMLGGNLVAFGVLAAARGWAARLAGLLEGFGRVPLFFYIAHLWFYGVLGAVFFRRPAGLDWMYAVWLAGLVPLWWMCRRYATFKSAKPEHSAWRWY